MISFLKSEYEFVLGCDPGPEHSAFALLDMRKREVMDVAYVPNVKFGACTGYQSFVSLLCREGSSGKFYDTLLNDYGKSAFVFEKCGVQAGGANAMVFETCMTAGEIRHLAGLMLPSYAFLPSDWRYILSGKGSANDTIIRNILLTLTPNCDTITRSYSTKAKKMLNLKKPITSHLRDAAGVALASGFLDYRKGLEITQFPARLEVHCG